MNNKGVTLIELLIVIVVIGIISAFAIPAVSGVIENSEKSSVLNDASVIESQARLYCGQNSCTDSQTLVWDDLKADISAFSTADYTETSVTTNTTVVATLSGGEWQVKLTGTGDNFSFGSNWTAANTFDAAVPSASTNANVFDAVTGP